MICAARDHPMIRESKAPGICTDYFERLPKVTRDLYAAGRLTVRRVGELARSRNMTASQVGAGRHTRHDMRK